MIYTIVVFLKGFTNYKSLTNESHWSDSHLIWKEEMDKSVASVCSYKQDKVFITIRISPHHLVVVS